MSVFNFEKTEEVSRRAGLMPGSDGAALGSGALWLSQAAGDTRCGLPHSNEMGPPFPAICCP